MYIRAALLTFFISLSPLAADLCPNNKKIKEVAKDLIEIEMSGIRLISGAKDNCLNKKFPNYKFARDADHDEPKKVSFYMDSRKDLEIVESVLTDKQVNTYEVSYSAKVETLNGKKKVIRDKFRFYLNTSPKAIKSDGCASTLTPAKHMVLLKSCKK